MFVYRVLYPLLGQGQVSGVLTRCINLSGKHEGGGETHPRFLPRQRLSGEGELITIAERIVCVA